VESVYSAVRPGALNKIFVLVFKRIKTVEPIRNKYKHYVGLLKFVCRQKAICAKNLK
jgi:hypothetical protein